MATIINNPGGGNNGGDDYGAGFIIGLILAILLVILFLLYGLPALRGTQTTPEPNNTGDTNINVELPDLLPATST